MIVIKEQGRGAPGVFADTQPGGGDLPVVFSGTLSYAATVLPGVSAARANTEIGMIGHTLAGLALADAALGLGRFASRLAAPSTFDPHQGSTGHARA